MPEVLLSVFTQPKIPGLVFTKEKKKEFSNHLGLRSAAVQIRHIFFIFLRSAASIVQSAISPFHHRQKDQGYVRYCSTIPPFPLVCLRQSHE